MFREVLHRYHATRALRRFASRGDAVRVEGRLWIHGSGKIVVGNRVAFLGEASPIELHVTDGATLVIEDDSIISGGTSIEATQSIVIGARCFLGPGCRLMDNDFHHLDERHELPPALPVHLADDVRVEERAVVLSGTSIGRHSLVAARSVVRGRVPDDSLVQGNPARWSPRSKAQT